MFWLLFIYNLLKGLAQDTFERVQDVFFTRPQLNPVRLRVGGPSHKHIGGDVHAKYMDRGKSSFYVRPGKITYPDVDSYSSANQAGAFNLNDYRLQ